MRVGIRDLRSPPSLPRTRHHVPRLPRRQRHQMLAEQSTECCHASEDAKIVLSPRFWPHFEEWSFAAQAASEYVEGLYNEGPNRKVSLVILKNKKLGIVAFFF